MSEDSSVIRLDNAEIANRRYKHIIETQSGIENYVVRPNGLADGELFRQDGFVNMLNKYGTSKDLSEHYQFDVSDEYATDEELTNFYVCNGLFSRIIDLPAEEAVKHGFDVEGLKDNKLQDFFSENLDELDWEENAMTALKWARLYGGAIAVMIIDDGRKLEEPLDWKNIKSIDNILVYDRSVAVPDYTSMFQYENEDPYRARGSRLGYPETYMVTSQYGKTFVVHESRCLVFRNGIIPEKAGANSMYRFWGIPEYVKVYRAVRDTEVAHGYATKLLDRSVQAIYAMKNLSQLLATEQGENQVMQRLRVIDQCRGLLNSMILDADGENYDFKSFSYAGVSDVINTTCNYLSAVTNIPQTILFGRSPAGMNATGGSDLENYYNYVERIQKRTLKANLKYLLAIIAQAGINLGKIDEKPRIQIEFKPLWSMSETEKVSIDAQKAGIQSTRAQTAQIYMQNNVLDPSEVRKSLAKDEDFDIEEMLDDFSEEEIEQMPQGMQQGGGDMMAALMGGGGGMPQAGGAPQNPQQPKMPDVPQGVHEKGNMPIKKAKEEPNNAKPEKDVKEDEEEKPSGYGVGVLVIGKDGNILTGTRMKGSETGKICGPGGHVENGETAEEAAIREAREEFKIKPTEMIHIGTTFDDETPEKLKNVQFLCTKFEGVPDCDGVEMSGCKWRDIDELEAMENWLFTPFRRSLDMLKDRIANGSIYPNKNSWEK